VTHPSLGGFSEDGVWCSMGLILLVRSMDFSCGNGKIKDTKTLRIYLLAEALSRKKPRQKCEKSDK
jgi:hypothetical protein